MARDPCCTNRCRCIFFAVTLILIVSGCLAVAIFFITKSKGEYLDASSLAGNVSLLYRLSNNLRPLHYELDIAPDIYQDNPSKFYFRGQIRILMLCKESTYVIKLHAAGLDIDNNSFLLTSNDDQNVSAYEIVSWELDDIQETLAMTVDRPLVAGFHYNLSMFFQAPITDKFRSLYYISYVEGNITKYIATTIFAPNYARRTFPCFDEPSLKVNFTLRLSRKTNFVSLGNMPVKSTERRIINDEVWFTDTFYTSPPMSTYLLAFCVCQFRSLEADTGRGYKFKVWSRAESIEDTRYALDVGTRVLPFFDDYFGIPFPLPEQEMIALPEFQYGGMEHWGLVSYKESSMLYSSLLPSLKDQQRIATVVAHEMAHMWFGDLLTMKWWDDAWLNEGFATFIQYVGLNHVFPQWRVLDLFLLQAYRSAMTMDHFEYSRALHQPVRSNNILAAYDRIIYYKGASILRMVKFFLGDDSFHRGIKKYLAKFQYGTATHTDLWEAFNNEAEAHGMNVNVSDVMLSWTVQSNFPVVTVLRNEGQLQVSQKRYLLEPASSRDRNKSYTWDIPFTFRTSRTHVPDRDLSAMDVIWLSRRQRRVTIYNRSISGASDKDDWILANVGVYGYYRVNYDIENWLSLIGQLHTNHSKIHISNRAQIIMDAWNLAAAGMLNYTIALQTIDYLHKEKSYLPWRAAILEIENIKNKLEYEDKVLGELKIFMQHKTQDLFEPYFHLEVLLSGDLNGLTPVLINEAACLFDLPECVAIAREQFVLWMKNPSDNPINVDLRSTYYCTAIAHGIEKEWEFVFLQYQRETSVSEKNRLRFALSCSRHNETILSLMKRSLDVTYIRQEDLIELLGELARNPAGRKFAWTFVVQNFDLIFEKAGNTAFVLKALFSGITQSFHTKPQLEELENFAGAHPQLSVQLSDSIQRVRANIRWAETHLAVIENWLREHNNNLLSS